MANAQTQPAQGPSINPYIVDVADAGGEVLKAYASHYLGSILRRQLPSHKKKKADAKLAATLLLMESFIGKLDHDDKLFMQRAYTEAKAKQESAVEGTFDFFFKARGYHRLSTQALRVAKSYSEKVREEACWAQITQEIALASQVNLANPNQRPDQSAMQAQASNPFADGTSIHSYVDSDQVSQLTAEVYGNDDSSDIVAVVIATTDAGNETSFVAGLHYDDTNENDAMGIPDAGLSVEMDISEDNVWAGVAVDGGVRT